jgi:hypothetical protein
MRQKEWKGVKKSKDIQVQFMGEEGNSGTTKGEQKSYESRVMVELL